MIAWLAGWGWAAPLDCRTLPALVVHRWTVEQDGRDLRGENPAAPADGVYWPKVPSLYDRYDLYAHLSGAAHFVVPDVDLPSMWLLEGRFDVRTSHAVVELLRVEGTRGDWLSLRYDPHLGNVSVEDREGRRYERLLVPGDERFGVGVDTNGVVVLLHGEDEAEPTGIPSPLHGVDAARVTIGRAVKSAAKTSVRDVVLHGDVPPVTARPWCLPSARDRVPYAIPETGTVTLEVNGYFLGLMGQYLAQTPNEAGSEWVARQRLLIAPTMHLSSTTRVVVGVRTLETRSLHATGSLVRPPDPSVSDRGEFGVVVEHAYLARYVGEWRVLPFYFVAGRVPLNFGLGLADRNSMARLGPSPPSLAELLDGTEVLESTNPDFLGDPSFPSTLDGAMLFLGNPPARQGASSLRALGGVRWGRRSPWCAGRISERVCKEELSAVYEAAGTVVIEQDVETGPLTGSDALIAQLEGGVRWGRTLRPIGFGRLGVSYKMPRAYEVWFDAAGEGLVEWGVPAATAAPELQGSVAGGAVHADLAFRRAPWMTLMAEGGATGGISGTMRSLHPDWNFDLVLFSQVIAGAVATEWVANEESGAIAPTLGGVVNAGFGRAGVTIRIGSRSGIEVPLIVTHARTLEPVPGVMVEGALGTELEAALRLNSGSWRFAAEVGVLVPGRGIDVALEDDLPAAYELRIGRNL